MRFLSLILPCFLITAPSPSGQQLADLIQALADPDPVHRAQAADQLRRLGPAARPALVFAARDENTSIATAAAEMLLAMPWYRPDDPPVMRTSLEGYGRADPAQRIEVIHQIALKYPQNITNRVLWRLLLEEPSEDVCWRIVSLLRVMMDQETHESLRAVDESETRASLLTLAARLCYGSDRARSHELLRRAIEIETRRPSFDAGELDFAFDALAGAATNSARYADALNFRRVQSLRTGSVGESQNDAIGEIFALHARHGPLDGFDHDLQTYNFVLGEAPIIYAMGLIYARGGQDLAARTCMQTAFMSSLTAQRRESAIRFLRQNQLDDLAIHELRSIRGGDEPHGVINRLRALFALAEVVGRNHHDAQAAAYLQEALGLIERSPAPIEVTDTSGQSAPFDVVSLRARIQWRRLRAARANGDPAANEHLARLLALKSANTEILTDVMPYLRSIGRNDDARQMFDHEYRKMRARRSAGSQTAAAVNELAWLCARTGEKPQEGLELAMRAAEMSPGEPAYLDTLAEANFQLKKFDEAIQLEQAALELQPGDPFMTEQLERFRKGKESG